MPPRLISIFFLAVLGTACSQHIGMWSAQDGNAPDSDQDGVLDPQDWCPGTPIRVPVDARGCNNDADGDGVRNEDDDCPGTPEGMLVNARGCPVDSDGDGVLDSADACPGTPEGTTVDGRGCPADSDGDGVVDGDDECPGTPPRTQVDRMGCADVMSQLPTLGDVHFETDSATLTPYAYPVLDEVAYILREYPAIRLRVIGHTDSEGAAAYNLDLSQRRARSVIEYLMSRGVDGSRLAALGMGEQVPIAPNSTPQGRARNRRVEFMTDGSLQRLQSSDGGRYGGGYGGGYGSGPASDDDRSAGSGRDRYQGDMLGRPQDAPFGEGRPEEEQIEQADPRSFRRMRMDPVGADVSSPRGAPMNAPSPSGQRTRGAPSSSSDAAFQRERERAEFLQQLLQQEMRQQQGSSSGEN